LFEAEPIRFGPFLLPVATLVVAAFVWLSAKGVDRLLPVAGTSWSERFGGALLLYLILYEISPLFTDPASVLEHPSSILYISGSPRGAMIAAGITAAYLVISFRRSQIPLSAGSMPWPSLPFSQASDIRSFFISGESPPICLGVSL